MSLDQKKLLEEFSTESQKIVIRLMAILKGIKGNTSLSSKDQTIKLEDFGNQVDRIMGAAQTLVLAMSDEHALDLISEYSSLCKIIAYRGAKVTENQAFYDLCVALLNDGAMRLQFLIENLDTPVEKLHKSVESSMIERFRWVVHQMNQENAKTGGFYGGKMSQTDVDDLIKKMGF